MIKIPRKPPCSFANWQKCWLIYTVYFDLQDYERVMRVKCEKGKIDSENIIALLLGSGFAAEVLEDEVGMNIFLHLS